MVGDGRIREGLGRTADPSTTLRSGRDDKGEGWSLGVKLATGMEGSALSIRSTRCKWKAMPSRLSSRPERSIVEGSAVRLSDFPNSDALIQSKSLLRP